MTMGQFFVDLGLLNGVKAKFYGTDLVHSFQISAAPGITADTQMFWPTNGGAAGSTLVTDGSGQLLWQGVTKMGVDWATADGNQKQVDHNFSTLDVMVQVYDSNGQNVEVQTTRNNVNTVTLASSAAPTGNGWRILIIAV